MRLPFVLVLALLAMAALWSAAEAQTPRMVRVDVHFQHAGGQSDEGVQGRGGIVITERGGVRPRGRISGGSTQTRTQQSTGIFTLVQDGGESTLTVATQLPFEQVAFYRDYATGAGHVVRGTVFRDVGTSLKVRASLLAGNQVRVRVTPSISWLTADGSGALDFVEAATEVIVASGQPVVIGGATTQTHAVTRQILGIGAQESSRATTVTLTATAQ
jgi:Bacterial type II and III secretion system protein